MQVHLFDSQSLCPLSANLIEAVVASVLTTENEQCSEVSLHCVDKESIGSLHAQYFADPSVTDCISFPMDGPEEKHHRILGEVFVCPEVAQDYAESHAGDPVREFILYVVHGLLHLLGYDDIDPMDREVMREAERRNLAALDAAGFFEQAHRHSVVV